MADLPGDARVDARIIVEQIRALGGQASATYRGNWLPQGTFDELLEQADREPIHFHESIHHLHQHWDRGPARAEVATGYGPKAIVRRILSRVVGSALDRYFAEEQEFRAALARSIDAIAYRVDEIASADERGIVDLLRNDLLDLARSVDERFAARDGEAPGVTEQHSGAGRVLVVTEHWGSEEDEAAAVTRLLAGALARTNDVEIIHLVDAVHEEGLDESVFRIHRVRLLGSELRTAAIVRAALASHDDGRLVPSALRGVLEDFEGTAPGAAALIAARAPDAVLLAGHRQPYDLSVLGDRVAGRTPRVVFCPMLTDLRRVADERVRRLVELADAIGVLHPGEARAIAQAFPERVGAIVPIDVALNLNRGATEQGLFGVGWFGRFVVAIRRFPADGPRFSRSATHEILRSSLPGISVAEVDGTRWRIADAENTVELPVNPTRVNLWRLMAHGLATIDLRPPGPFGREAIESMLLATPVVVPDESAAMEHVAAANGGLWYRDAGELLDAVRIIVGDNGLRHQLGQQGQAYAIAHHGDMADFVTRTDDLLGGRWRAAITADPPHERQQISNGKQL